ncbi:HAMP domain-containing sensor histidine kinase [Cetobacterium somerae]|uniref:HAMP domain-containing sensor histidine kinase n=1 Tax=Cetobacterium somerae TaxID=188913 RepID=UPI003D768480
MKLRNKLIVILSSVLLISLFLEGVLGDIYFEKYFRYSKVLQLEKIDFIHNNEVDYDKLKDYEKNQNALVMIYHDKEIENLNNFHYIKVHTESGDAYILLDAFLDNLYSNKPFKAQINDLVEIKAIKILNNYYLPTSLIKNNEVFKDYKFDYTSKKIHDITGRVEGINAPYTQSNLGDDFLEALLNIDVLTPQNKVYDDVDGDDQFQVITLKKDDFKVVIFYSYENIKDIFPSLKLYFYFKGGFIVLLTILLGIILEKTVVKPIVKLSEISERIANLKFIKEINYNGKDEIGILYKDIFKMSEKLEQIIDLYKIKISKNREAQIKLEESIKLFMHEVKTPLSAIIGFSDLLLEDSSSEEIEIINVESKRILKMANNLLMDNSFSHEEIVLDIKKFNLTSLIELCLKIFEKDLENSEKSIVTFLWKDIYISGDKEKLEQVILNILKNALKYAKKEIRIYVEEKENEVILFLENDGPLIKEENLNRVWDKFYSTNSEERGLGLYVTSQILEAHKFKYGVRNNNFGVSFFIVFKKEI